MEIVYRTLGPSDSAALKGLIDVYREVFELELPVLPAEAYLQALLKKEHVRFCVALDGGNVVGGLTAFVLPDVKSEGTELYLYDLGVRTAYQRRGIGRRLLEALKSECHGLGASVFFVQADLEDEHALDFYRATGGKEAPVVHFTYDLR